MPRASWSTAQGNDARTQVPHTPRTTASGHTNPITHYQHRHQHRRSTPCRPRHQPPFGPTPHTLRRRAGPGRRGRPHRVGHRPDRPQHSGTSICRQRRDATG